MTSGVLSLACAVLSSTAVFHLDPSLPKDGDGSAARPFARLATAQAAVRAAVAKGDGAEVVVADGRYAPEAVLRFAAADSGTAQCPVRWRAATKGGVTLTGGVPLPPFAAEAEVPDAVPSEARARVRSVDLSALKLDDLGKPKSGPLRVGRPEAPELVWAGRVQRLARWPNEGFTTISSVSNVARAAAGKRLRARSFVPTDARTRRWATEAHPYGSGFFGNTWAADRVAFSSVDPAEGRFRDERFESQYGYVVTGLWFGFNLLCELDAPGEYYVDRETKRLWFWPPSEGTGELTRLADLVHLDGLAHVSFEGFALENCRARGVFARNVRHVGVTACRIRNVGTVGFDCDGGSFVRLCGCDVADCGEGGVRFVNAGDPATLTRAGCRIENCHICRYARNQLTYAAAVVCRGCGVTVTRNTIHDGPHTAIVFGGRENEFSFNEIHSVCRESGEMGAIYTGRDWTLCGNRIVGNYLHDIYNPRASRNRGVMIDDGGAGLTVASNRFVRVAEGVSLSAVGNRIENNLFVSNFPPIGAWQKWEYPTDYADTRYTHPDLLRHLSKVPVDEEPWKSRYPYLSLLAKSIREQTPRDPRTRSVIRDNWAFGGAPTLVRFNEDRYAYSTQTWDIAGNAVGPQPPATFRPLPPLSAIGVHAAPERLTWPVVHPLSDGCRALEPPPRPPKAKSPKQIVSDIAASDARIAAAQARLKDACSLADYRSSVRCVGGTNVWTDAFNRALEAHEIVRVPAGEYFVDSTVFLPSDRRIEAASNAVIRMMAPMKTALLLTKSAADGGRAPIDPLTRGRNIAVIGGRWVDWHAKRASEGASGKWTDGVRLAAWPAFRGLSALFYVGNADLVTVRDVTIENAGPFAIQTGDCNGGLFAHLRFVGCKADGVHVNGNVRNIHVCDVAGEVRDDLVALNFCDWPCSSVNFGPGDTVLAEDLRLEKGSPWFRLLPATHFFADGSKVDCMAWNVLVRRVTGVNEFKMYLQTRPYPFGKLRDKAEPGSGGSIWFEDIAIRKSAPPATACRSPRDHVAPFEIGSNLADVHFKNLTVDLPKDHPYVHLVNVGPKSRLTKDGQSEVFDPWVSCRVGRLELENVRYLRSTPAEEVHAVVFDDINHDGLSSGRGEVGEVVRNGK